MAARLAEEFNRGIITENPLIRLTASLCPSLAVCVSLQDAAGMGCAMAFVLVCTNAAVSLVRKALGERVLLLCLALIAASFATIADILMKAYLPHSAAHLGIYVPLLAINALVLSRADRVATHAGMSVSVIDAIVMSAGFAVSLCLITAVREFAGTGAIAGVRFGGLRAPLPVAALAPGGLIILGFAVGCAQALQRRKGMVKR
jgi:electron transport complex protein RnfE